MSAHPLHSPPPLMLPVTASYDLIISENSLICPCPPSYPSSRLSKDSDSGAFCSEGGRGWQVAPLLTFISLAHIPTILFDNIFNHLIHDNTWTVFQSPVLTVLAIPNTWQQLVCRTSEFHHHFDIHVKQHLWLGLLRMLQLSSEKTKTALLKENPTLSHMYVQG